MTKMWPVKCQRLIDQLTHFQPQWQFLSYRHHKQSACYLALSPATCKQLHNPYCTILNPFLSLASDPAIFKETYGKVKPLTQDLPAWISSHTCTHPIISCTSTTKHN